MGVDHTAVVQRWDLYARRPAAKGDWISIAEFSLGKCYEFYRGVRLWADLTRGDGWPADFDPASLPADAREACDLGDCYNIVNLSADAFRRCVGFHLLEGLRLPADVRNLLGCVEGEDGPCRVLLWTDA